MTASIELYFDYLAARTFRSFLELWQYGRMGTSARAREPHGGKAISATSGGYPRGGTRRSCRKWRFLITYHNGCLGEYRAGRAGSISCMLWHP